MDLKYSFNSGLSFENVAAEKSISKLSKHLLTSIDYHFIAHKKSSRRHVFTRVGQTLFRSFQKERQGAIHSFACFKKSKKERLALSLFSKRAQKSDSLFHSFKKSEKERFALSLFSKRATKSESLFRSFP